MSELESVDVAVSPSDKFQEYLSTQGMRLTHERATIVEDVFSQHEHFDADQIVERLTVTTQKGRVSRASVYRTLTLMEDAGLIRKVARNNDREVYEHDYGYPQHDHLICNKCGDMIEFHNTEIASVLEEVATLHGFRMSGHRLEVFGRCKSCSQPKSRRNPKLDLL